MKKIVSCLISIFFFISIATELCAFPDKEISGITGGPPFDFGFTDSATSFFLKEDRYLLVTYGEKLAIVDLAFYALTAEQPYDVSTDDDEDNDSPFEGAAYVSSRDEVVVSQANGHILIYSIADPAEEPTDIVISQGSNLGPVVVDSNNTYAYIANNTDMTVHRFNLGTLAVDATITVNMTPQTSFSFTKGVYVPSTSEIWFSTDKGGVVVIPAGGTTSQIVDIDVTNGNNITGVARTPSDTYIFASNYTTSEAVKISASNLTISKDIDLTPNNTPSDVIATKVTNPSGTYIYVAGGKGVSVIDNSTDQVLDLGSGTDDHEPIPTSSAPKKLVPSTDGYVYISLSTTSVGIISANPWVTISDVSYSDGGDSLSAGGTVLITFNPSEDVTYELMVGGDVDQSGSLLKDINGDTTGSAVGGNDLVVEIPYDSNSSLFDEGDNTVFVFGTDSDNDLGRHAAAVLVDNPPDVVTLRSTSFGRERIYVTFDRLTASDISHYNIYVDTDPDAVLTKTDIGASKSQPESGSTVTGEVGGLENGTLYYIAVEAVDEGGNISPSRASTLPDGSRATATPQETVGPAGFSGEKGCTLISNENDSGVKLAGTFLILISLISVMLFRARRYFFLFTLIVFISFLSVNADAYADETPQWWSFEVKTGFWMPTASKTKKFFDPCCNIITRVQGGLLVHGRYGVEQGVGFMLKNGNAIGLDGSPSEDRFSFTTIPMETNFVWRVDYWDWKYILPYFKTGIDYVYFRENVKGDITEGIKWGAHGVGGMQISLGAFFDDVGGMDQEYGVNDVLFTLEGQYQWINNFGGGGLDLSGWLFSVGLLFTF